MSYKFKYNNGNDGVGLNNNERAKKFKKELETGKRYRNDMTPKENIDKNGKTHSKLTKEQEAFRNGWLSAHYDHNRERNREFIKNYPKYNNGQEYQHKTDAGKKKAEKRKAWFSKRK